jgi:hypothetical protein
MQHKNGKFKWCKVIKLEDKQPNVLPLDLTEDWMISYFISSSNINLNIK